MATIKGLREDGTLPSVARAEVEQIAAEAAAQAGGGLPVQRLTLTADMALDTSAWPTEQVVALVVVQDATGGHALTLDGKDVAVAAEGATVTAWVHDGTAWTWRSSAGTVAATPPVWAAGTTVSLGTPTDTSVPVVFSKAVPAGAVVQWRAGAADSWRTLTMDSETTATIGGLTASTAYPAPQFRLISEGGESSVLTATAFTTQAPPPGWKIIRRATFTTDVETPLADYQPEIGPKLTVAGGGLPIVTGGHVEVRSTGGNGPVVSVEVGALGALSKRVRLTFRYSGLTGRTTPLLSLGWSANDVARVVWNRTEIALTGEYRSAVETTGLTLMPPASGEAVLTGGDDDTITFTIGGVVYRSWKITWNSAITRYQDAGIFVSAGDIEEGGAQVSSLTIDEWTVEEWQ